MTFNLTKEELKVAYILTNEALASCCMERPSDFEYDEHTWVDPKDLTMCGYTTKQAAGFFSSLSQKGFILIDDDEGTCITTSGWKWIDTIWDELEDEYQSWVVYNESDSKFISVVETESEAEKIGQKMQDDLGEDTLIAWTTKSSYVTMYPE